MKQFFKLVGALLITGASYAQTDPINLDKYWKLRNDFREDFVRIGSGPGKSLVARGLKPLDCIDNINFDGTGFGEIHWGDGMIRHGYYLGLLATEYRLLRDANQDVTGVLNELYYALAAINRLDFQAEIEQSQCYGFNQSGSLNGFYMREDIPADFAADNWGNSKLNAQCVNSSHYETNNAARLDNTGQGLKAKGNSYQNTPSADQFSSLLLGFRLIHKLVDNWAYAQPPGESGFYVVNQVQTILNRMMTYLNERNWMMIDVNGWPVNNGGGDCVLTAYPISKAAKIITGNDYDTDWDRKLAAFNIGNVQYCITGFGLEQNDPVQQMAACASISGNQQLNALDDLSGGVPPGPLNNQDNSIFQQWLAANGAFNGVSGEYDFSAPVWNMAIPALLNDFADDKKFSIFPLQYANLKWNLIGTDGQEDAGNFAIIGNYGIASGLWNGQDADAFGDITGNRQLELINAVLRNEAAPNSKAFYKAFMDEMQPVGPYNLYVSTAIPNGTATVYGTSGPGWSSEHRWTWSSDANGQNQNSVGIFNGMDYMLFHNLYRILYKNSIAEPFDVKDECFCGTAPTVDISALENNPNFPAIQAANNTLTSKLTVTNHSVGNVIPGNISTSFDVTTFFPDYIDKGIVVPKFQTADATILNNGYVHAKTRFIICNNSTLTIDAGGKLGIEKFKTVVNGGSKIDLSGEVIVKDGTQLVIKNGAQLVIKAGGKLTIEDHATVTVEQGGTLIYENGAAVITKAPGSYIEMKGNLSIGENATFTLDHSTATESGLMIFEGVPQISAKPGAKIHFTAKGNWDPIVLVRANSLVRFADTDLRSVRFEQSAVVFEGQNASMRSEQPFYAVNSTFKGNGTTGSLLSITDRNNFSNINFIDFKVVGEMDLENKDRVNMNRCDFTQSNSQIQVLTGVQVIGQGYRINNCNFSVKAAGNAVLESEAATVLSTLTNSTFQSANNGSGDLAVYDVSNSEIKVSSCTFTGLSEAIQKTGGTLTLRCNTFLNSRNRNVTVSDGCLLNMSTGNKGGYNNFHPLSGSQSGRSHILLNDALIDMHNGSNYISDVPVNGGLVKGTLNTFCSNSGTCYLIFDNNQWNSLNPNAGPALSSRFNIKSANTMQVAVYTPLAQAMAHCGALDPSSPFVVGVNSGGTPISSQMPTYTSTLDNVVMKYDEGIHKAAGLLTDLNDDQGDNLLAIEYLNEIFSSNPDMTNKYHVELLRIAADYMKIAVGSAMVSGEISMEDNDPALEPHVMMYIKALNTLTSAVTMDNYEVEFYNELDKAEALRSVGQFTKGLEILTKAETCRLDAAEQRVVNRHKKYFLRDLKIAELKEAALDTVIVIDSSSFVVPQAITITPSFGAIISSLDNIAYPRCNNSSRSTMINHQGEAVETDINVYPNPAQFEVNVELKHETMEGKSTLIFYQADGRVVETMEFFGKDNPIVTVKVSSWSPGTYQYKYVRPDGAVSTGKLIVHNN